MRGEASASDPLLEGSHGAQCCFIEVPRGAAIIVLCTLASLAVALVVGVVMLLLKNFEEYGIGVTPLGGDPYATGRFVPCIYGSFPCLWNWCDAPSARPSTPRLTPPCRHRRNISSTEWGYVCTLAYDCPNDSGAKPTLSVIMTILGSAEAAALAEAMHNTSPEVHQVFCDHVLRGSLYARKALLVTVSKGRDRASVCMSDLLRLYGRLIAEVIFVGTGRFSPMAGGILDPTNCSEALPASRRINGREVPVTIPGDVCVSRVTASWDCQRCADDDDEGAATLSGSTAWWSACRSLHCQHRSSQPIITGLQTRPEVRSGALGSAGHYGALPIGRLDPSAASSAKRPATTPSGAPTPDVPAPVKPSVIAGSNGAACEYWCQSADLAALVASNLPGSLQGLPTDTALANYTRRFWSAMSEGTGERFVDLVRERPMVLSGAECGEASSETMWCAPRRECPRRPCASPAHGALRLQEGGPV